MKNTKLVNLRMPKEMNERLNQLSKELYEAKSTIIRAAINEYLLKYEIKEKK